MTRSVFLSVPLILLVLSVPSVATARIWYVKADRTGDVPSIQAGVDAASAGDVVLLAAGVYMGYGNRYVNIGGKAITITSEDGPEVTILDGNGTAMAFCLPGLEGRSTVISGLRMVNCVGPHGGAILCFSSPTITNNIFEDNDSPVGGGIYIVGGAPEVTDNTFIGNTADYGGAIYIEKGAPVISGNTIVYSGARISGSGIYVTNSNPTIDRTIVAFGTGGAGIACAGGATPVLACCNIFGNAGGNAICGTDGGGNVPSDPMFCGIPNSDNYLLMSISPCAPGNNTCGVQIGAWPVGCQSTPTHQTTWGGIKFLFVTE